MNKHLSWNQYFMSLAKVASLRSKDPNTQVGAAIVNNRHRVIALGYNGMPNGNDKDFPWQSTGEKHETKYAYVVHAEVNAVLNTTQPVKDSSLYVTLFPCPECAKFLIQAGIKKVYYESNKYSETQDAKIAKKIFDTCNIEYEQLDPIEVIVK